MVTLYRVTQQDSDLGLVNFDFGCSRVCLIVIGLIGEPVEELMIGMPKYKST